MFVLCIGREKNVFATKPNLDFLVYDGITSCPVCMSHRSRSPRMELTYVVRAHVCACARSFACPYLSVRVCMYSCVSACVRKCSRVSGTTSLQTR